MISIHIRLAALSLVCGFALFPQNVFAQQRPPFSEKTVTIEDYTSKDLRTFMPFTKGETEINTSGPYKPLFDKICSVITKWGLISPPQGIRVFCYGYDNWLEVYFSPYMFEGGAKYPSEGYSKLSICFDNPDETVGTPAVPGIYCCPQKTADFYGRPVYGNVTVVEKTDIPIYVPVSREEYLRALISDLRKGSAQPTSGQDYKKALQEMEKNYRELQKYNKEAAEGVRQAIEELKLEMNRGGDGISYADKTISDLENEIASMSVEERKSDAYYGGESFSRLVPYGQDEFGELLVKVNPALVAETSKGKAFLTTIVWDMENITVSDQQQLYADGKLGFWITDYLMHKLSGDSDLWGKILNILK